MFDVVTLGETMVAFAPCEKGPIRYSQTLSKRTAGAESNVAIGLAKLGKKAGWFSKLGEDEFGEYILRELRGENVDTSSVIMSRDNPTGIMFKQFSAGNETSVFYYRKGSAASTISTHDLPLDYIKQAKILHISGITPALSESCKEAIFNAVRFAREQGVKISFDPNIRLKLWSKQEAKHCLTELLPLSDIVLIGEDEADILFGTKDPAQIVDILRKYNVSHIAVKLGADGAVVADQTTDYAIPARPVQVVDNIGAGDAFNAGFLCGLLEDKDLETCGRLGTIMGAYAVSSNGDVEGLPSRSQVDALINQTEKIYR